MEMEIELKELKEMVGRLSRHFPSLEREELLSEGWILLQRIKEKNEKYLRRALFLTFLQLELQSQAPVSIPKNSCWRTRKRFSSASLPDVSYRSDFTEKFFVKKLLEQASPLERRVAEVIMDGGRLSEFVKELQGKGVLRAKYIVYKALDTLRQKAMELAGWRK